MEPNEKKSIIRSKKYTALDILSIAFPEGVTIEKESGKGVEHTLSKEDIEANPELVSDADLKEGDVVLIPETEIVPVASVFGKYRIVIGGISGINDPARNIIVDGESPIEISVGSTFETVNVEEAK